MTTGRQEFLGRYDVSRETVARLDTLANLVDRWSRRINLISKATLPELWTRHFADSAQILELAPQKVEHWADLGSGGGFPALVVGVLSRQSGGVKRMTLVESDQRKATFLRAAIRELDLEAQVLAERIEQAPALEADILSARALAPLDRLCEFAERHLAKGGTALFPKGATHARELETALERWRFRCETHSSQTDPHAVVFSVSEIQRA